MLPIPPEEQARIKEAERLTNELAGKYLRALNRWEFDPEKQDELAKLHKDAVDAAEEERRLTHEIYRHY